MKVKNLSYKNAGINGLDFSGTTAAPYLHGNVGDYVKVEFDLEIESYAIADPGNPWTVSGSAGSFTITWAYGSFVDAGLYVGQNYKIKNAGGTVISSGTIAYVDALLIDLTETGGTGLSAGTLNSNEKIFCTDNIDGLVYRPNVIENSNTYDSASIINGKTTEYYIAGLSISGSYSNMARKGIAHPGVTGSAQVRYVSNTDGLHSLKIREYLVIPVWTADWQLEYDNVTPPHQLTDRFSLKHVFEVVARHDYNNPNSQLTGQWDQTKGSVGWYGESFDGSSVRYSVNSVEYLDHATLTPIDSISINRKTRVRFNLVADASHGSYHKIIPFVITQISDYPTKEHDAAFLADRLKADYNSAASGTGRIKRVSYGSTGTTTSVIEVDIEYSADDKAAFDFENIKWILGLSVCDTSDPVSASDKCTLLVATGNYDFSADVAGLLTWNTGKVYPHNVPTADYSDYKGFVNDSLAVESEFEVKTSDGAKLAGMKIQVVAVDDNTGADFIIDSREIQLGLVSFDLSSRQYLNVNTTRGYRQLSTDKLNKVELTVDNSGLDSVFTVKYGMNIPWQEWIQNLNVDPDFIDLTEPQRNLNKKASNYDGVNDYSVFIRLLAEVENSEGVTEYAQDIACELYDLGPAPSPEWTAEVKLLSDGVETGVIDKTEKTTVQVVFTPTDLGDLSAGGFVGVIRLEKKNQPDEDFYEIDTAKLYTHSVLIPPAGETYATVDISASDVTIEAQIDGSKLDRNAEYVIYGRLYHDGGAAPIAELLAHTHVGGSDGDVTIPVRLKKADNTTTLANGKDVEIVIQIDGSTVETLEGTTGQALSDFTTDVDPAFSVKAFTTGNISDGATLTWAKKNWANKTLNVNEDAEDVTWIIRAKDYGQWSATDSEVVPVYDLNPGQGFILSMVHSASNEYYMVDYENGIRVMRDNTTFQHTARLGTTAKCYRVAVDATTPSNPKVFTVDADAAGTTNQVLWWTNTNRIDKGGSGTPNTHALSIKGASICTVPANQNNSMPDLWVGGRLYNGKLLLLRRTSPTAYAEFDFSSVLATVTGWSGASITNVLLDANGKVWVFGHVAGSGNGIAVLTKTGGGAYTDTAQWSISRIMSFNGDALSTGNGSVARTTNPMQQAAIVGYDSTYGATSGTNPILMWASFADTMYAIMQHNGGSDPDARLNWTLSTPALLCGTSGTNTWGTGSGSTEIGNARVTCLNGTTFYGGGQGTPDRVLIKRINFNNSGGTQTTSVIFGPGTGYDEQQQY